MDNDGNTPKFDICDSLDELKDIHERQVMIKAAHATIISTGKFKGDAVLQPLEAEMDSLEFDAAAVSSEIVQTFVDMRKRIARLEEDLKDAKDELSMEHRRGQMNAIVARALGSSY